MIAQDFKELHRLAVAERKALNDRMANVSRYDGVLSHHELSPNGDDYNAIIEMLGGATYRTPNRENR